MFCEGLRARLFKSGVSLTDIRPGFVATPMTRGLPLPAPLGRLTRIGGAAHRRRRRAPQGRVVHTGVLGADHARDPLHTAIRLQAPEAVTESGTPLLSGWRYRAVIWSVILAAAGYLVFALWGGWNEVVHALAQVGLIGIAVSLALSLVNYGLRFLRWQTYLRAMDHPVPWRPKPRHILSRVSPSTTTPGKAGEALRGVLLKRWGVPYPQSLAAFLSERLSDLVAILLLTLFGLSIYPAARAHDDRRRARGARRVHGGRRTRAPSNCCMQRLHGEGRFAKLLRHGLQVLLQAQALPHARTTG